MIELEKPKAKSILNVNNMKNNKHKLVLLCSECNQGYSTTADLKNHMIMVTITFKSFPILIVFFL